MRLRAAPAAAGTAAQPGRLMVGIGYDSHRFADDRPLILGGVEIDYTP
jgi:hypothetical protein